jgi:hypothetical protein
LDNRQAKRQDELDAQVMEQEIKKLRARGGPKCLIESLMGQVQEKRRTCTAVSEMSAVRRSESPLRAKEEVEALKGRECHDESKQPTVRRSEVCRQQELSVLDEVGNPTPNAELNEHKAEAAVHALSTLSWCLLTPTSKLCSSPFFMQTLLRSMANNPSVGLEQANFVVLAYCSEQSLLV